MWLFPTRTARRPLPAGLATASVTVMAAVVVVAGSAVAATTTLYASPSGTGSTCSSTEPCSLAAAQVAVDDRTAEID